MNKKIEKQIIFVLLIVIIMLFSIPQILPWFSINYQNTDISTFYSWGAKSEVVLDTGQPMALYLTGFFETLDAINNIPQENSEQIEMMKNAAVGQLLLFLCWLLSLLTIIFALLTFYYLYQNKEEKMHKWAMSTSITSIIVLFLFYITITFIIMDSLKNLLAAAVPLYVPIALNSIWSIGFFMFILGIIFITGVALKNIFIKFSNRITAE